MLDDSLHPTFNFSEAEFVQAGLLPATSFSTCTQEPECSPASADTKLGTPADVSRAAGQHHHPGSPPGYSRSPLQQVTHRQVQDLETVRGSTDKKQANREHQRKFRERQKVQAQALKAQLANTVKELENMKLHKQELENRLTQQDSQSPEAEVAQIDKKIAERAPDCVSIAGQEFKLSIEPWHSTPIGRYHTVWKDHAQMLQSCLSAVQADPDRATPKVRLAELVFEGLRLRAQHLSGNGSLGPSGATWLPGLSDSKSTADLLGSLGLSSKQEQDLLLVRRVYLLKLHNLNQQQAALAAQMPNPSSYPLCDVTRVTSVTSQLRRNAAERYQLVHSFTRAVYFGVFTMQQTATVLVESAPDRPLAEHLVNHTAEEQGLPCKQEMLADASESLSEQDWRTFAQYAEDIDCFNRLHDDSVPISTSEKSVVASGLTLY